MMPSPAAGPPQARPFTNPLAGARPVAPAGQVKPGELPTDAADEGALSHHTDAVERELGDDDTSGLHPKTADTLRAHYASAGMDGDTALRALHATRATVGQTSINRAHGHAAHLEQRAAAVGAVNPRSPHIKRALDVAGTARGKATAYAKGFDSVLGAAATPQAQPGMTAPAPAPASTPFTNPLQGGAAPTLAGTGGPPALPRYDGA